jgi:hypothetical protein
VLAPGILLANVRGGAHMQRNARDVQRYTVVATDGELGSVHDLFFDDESWSIRYVVVDTGQWLPGRRVLISPLAVRELDEGERRLALSLTRQQIEDSPDIDTHQPVSRQQELNYFKYYGYPPYWAGPAVAGTGPYPGAIVDEEAPRPPEAVPAGDDSHLRSCREVTGYHLHASDGSLGHVDDFLFDDTCWAITFIVVDTSDWWFGRRVLVAPDWIEAIDWSRRDVRVEVTRESVRSAPRFDSVAHANDQWQADYHAHHGRPAPATREDRRRAIMSRLFRPPVITK